MPAPLRRPPQGRIGRAGMAETSSRRPRLIRFGALALLALAVLAGGWAWAWHVAAGQTEAVLDAWMLRESEVGHVWTCPGRTVAGFPFAIRVRCAAPRFSGDLEGTQTEGALGGFEAVAAVYHPTEIRADLTGPFTLETADGETDLAIGWSRLRLVLAGLPTAVSQISVVADDMSLSGTVAGLGAVVAAKAAAVTASARRDAGRTDEAYEFSFAATGAAVPLIDALLGGAVPASIDIAGTLTQADFTAPGLPLDRIERWRAAGGHIDLAHLVFSRGPMRLEASGGPLSLDPAHRPQGRLDARAEGFDPVLRRLGVNPAVVAIGGLLGGVLGARPQGGGGLHLPLGFDHGLLVIGPVRTSITAPPLY